VTNPRATPRHQHGTTLIELVMTIMIIGIAIAGVVGAFSLASQRSADPLIQSQAVELAQLYMDEILAKKYDDATPQGGTPKYSGSCSIGPNGEDRASFDDVDDYHNPDVSPPANAEGVLSRYQGFSVSISVSCAGADLGLAASEAKRVDLSISTPNGQTLVFTAYRVNF
tara:strand:+ start:193 stop:699 length:507 start_codon:yes stop_codon:yes gene_type:complete